MSRLSAVGISGLQAGEDVKEYITYVEDGSGASTQGIGICNDTFPGHRGKSKMTSIQDTSCTDAGIFHSESIFFRRLPDPGIRGSLESGSPGVPRGLVYSDGRRDRRGNRAYWSPVC